MTTEAPITQTEPKGEAPKVEVPKEKVKRLPKPDKPAFERQLEQVDAEIKKHHERIAELKQMIDDKMAGKDSSSAESRAVANRIAALSNEFDIKLGQKKAYQKQLEEVRRSQDDLKSAARDLRGSLQFIKLEDIDVQIARLEEKLTHTTVDLTEERRLVDQMRDLTKSRSKVAEYQAQVDRIQGDQSLKDDLVKKIQDIDNEIDAIKAKKEQEKAVLQKLREKEAGKAQDIPSLMTAKQAAYEVTLELREAKKKMIQEFRAKEDEFYARERIWREQQNQARHAQYLQRQAQRDARDAERKFMDDAIKGDPFAEELVLCDQLLAYLARFQVKEDVKEEGSKGPAAELEGMKILRKKLNDDELDGMFAGVGKKGGKGKAPAKKEEAKRDESSARVTHTLDMITAFDRVKVPAPTTRGQAASAFATVEEKKALFAEMQRQELEERKRRRDAGEISDEEEATEGAADAPAPEDAPATAEADAAGPSASSSAPAEPAAAAAAAPAPKKSAWGKPPAAEEPEAAPAAEAEAAAEAPTAAAGAEAPAEAEVPKEEAPVASEETVEA